MLKEDADGGFTYPDEQAADCIYRGTPKGSPARQLMVDTWISRGNSDWLDGEFNVVNQEFLFDLTTAMLGVKKSPGKHIKSLKRGVATKYYKAVEAELEK